MKLGVYIHGSSPFNPKDSLDTYYKMSKNYEELGIDTLWFADHFIRTPEPQEQPLHETWALMTAIGMKTEKIRLGTMVTPITFRNFGYFAKMITTIDHITNGRITLGLGTGWYRKEHEMFGIDMPSQKERFQLLEESIILLKQLWWQEKVTSPEGYLIQIKAAYLNPKSVQTPHPPILIGGEGEKKTLKFVAKYGNMSNFGGSIENIKHKIEVLRSHCMDLGRKFNDITVTTNRAIILGKDEKDVEDGIKKYRERFVELGMQAPSLDTFRDIRLVGTPEQVVDQVKQLGNIGVSMINMTINDVTTENLLPDLCKLLK